MTYNVYQNNELIAEGIEKKEYTVDGLTPNTEYSFSVTEVVGDNESEKSEAVTVTTNYSEPTAVSVSPKTNNLEVGGTRDLTATVEPGTAKQSVTWTTSDDSVATVNNGTVTAIGTGEATITATSTEASTSGTATVNVTEPDPEGGA